MMPSARIRLFVAQHGGLLVCRFLREIARTLSLCFCAVDGRGPRAGELLRFLHRVKIVERVKHRRNFREVKSHDFHALQGQRY